MKILIATGLYPPDIGGPATYARMLEEELPKAGIEPVIIPFGIVRHLPKIIRHLSYAKKLWAESKDCGAIYALDSISVGLPAWLVSKLRRKPFLIRLGGDYAWEQGRMRFGLTTTLDEYTADPHGRPLPVRILAWLQAFVVRRAQTVVLPSEYLKRIVMTWGVREEKIAVINSALFPLPVSESRAELRKKLSYEGVVYINAGRLTPWKGIDTIIELVAMQNKVGEDVTLVIAGEGEVKESLMAKAKELEVENKIRFVGRLSKEALGAAIKGADVFVYNTQYEGLPHQLLEVMDLSVPIVTTDIPGNREIINDGVQGLLVPANDLEAMNEATKRILNNAQLRQRLVQNARMRSKDFEQEKVIQKLVVLLKDVLT